jgi:hypothetical protein
MVRCGHMSTICCQVRKNPKPPAPIVSGAQKATFIWKDPVVSEDLDSRPRIFDHAPLFQQLFQKHNTKITAGAFSVNVLWQILTPAMAGVNESSGSAKV